MHGHWKELDKKSDCGYDENGEPESAGTDILWKNISRDEFHKFADLCKEQ